MLIMRRLSLLALLLLLSCTGMIKHADRLIKDPYLIWSNSEYTKLDARTVLENTELSEANEIQNDRALAFARLGQPDRAERIFYEILARDPYNLTAYLNLMRIYALLESQALLEKIDKRLILQGARDQKVILNLAQSLANQNRQAEARTLFRVLFRERQSITAALWLAADHFTRANFVGARDMYEAVLELEPDNKEALFGMGWFYYQAKSYELALEYLTAAQASGLQNSRHTYLLARSYYHLQKDKLALQLLQKTPAKLRNIEIIELHGTLLLNQDPARDVRFLLDKVSKNEFRKQLLLKWYGTYDYTRYKKNILPEFQQLY